MTPQQRALKRLSHQQRVVYTMICEAKQFKANGALIVSCNSLVRAGLIKQNPESNNKHDYVLNGEPVQLPPEKLPTTKTIVDAILDAPAEPKHIPFVPIPFIRPSADHTNLSREDHVRKWISTAVTPGQKALVKVKCLQEWQMKYVVNNYKETTAQQMADRLKVDIINVKIFCQANDFEPLPDLTKGKRNVKDSFHSIPESRKLRMKRLGYNGPQKKTA